MSKESTSASSTTSMGFWARVVDLYADGFRSMTLGKTLWLIIAIKLFVFFVIIKVLFFPNFLSSMSSDDEGKAQYVRQQMVDRAHTP